MLSSLEIVIAVAAAIIVEELTGVRLVEFSAIPPWLPLVVAGVVAGLNHWLLLGKGVIEGVKGRDDRQEHRRPRNC